MKLRYHSDSAIFYDENGNLYPEPAETLETLEAKMEEACNKLKSLPSSAPVDECTDDDDDLLFDIGMARFNLCSLIENLEWKIDLNLTQTMSAQ